jgi:hypothetical protein
MRSLFEAFMSAFFSLFGELTVYPWVAFVIAGAFAVMGRIRPRVLVRLVAVLWLLYGLYESGMRARLLCSGECDIRIDLLLIYPVLGVLSVIALLMCWGQRRHSS